MDVLIVAANRSRQPSAVMPFGACIIAEAAERAGHSVRLLDLMFEKDPLRALEEELEEAAPDVIGISVRNIDNNDMQKPAAYFKDLPPIIDVIRRKTGATVVLGGAAVGVMPEEFLRYTGLRFAVIGDGETAFPELIEAISRGEGIKGIAGAARLEDGLFEKNPPSASQAYGACPAPSLARWLDIKPYLLSLSCAPVQTRRGCPFDCVYCTYAVNEGRNYRLYSADSVVSAVANLVRAGLRDIEFVDNVFNSPYEYAMNICAKLAEAKLKARLQTLELNPRFIDDAILDAMEKAGFVGIGVTLESASDKVLLALKKDFTAEQIARAAGIIEKHKIPCAWIFMLGGPGETKETVLETLDFASCHIRPRDVAFFNIGVRIYPGTELERMARDEGALTLSADEMLEPVFYFSRGISLEWLLDTLKRAISVNLNFITSNSIGLSFLPKIHRLGCLVGMRPPLWRHTSFIRKALRLAGLEV